ncbi:MAG: hypothetical protein AAGA25_14585 [Planctomycetota bacterium]
MMFLPAIESRVLGLAPWWSSALGSDLGVRCAVIVAVGVVLLAVALRAAWVLWWARPVAAKRSTMRQRLAGESGTATVEFVMVFVPALGISLILLQTMLMFSGNLFVHYAAFVATRSAIVEAPRGELGGGGYLADENDPAFDQAQRAAAFALAPVSGREGSGGGGDAIAFEAGLQAYFTSYGEDAPAWVDRLAAERLAYALDHTTLELYETRVSDRGEVVLDKQTGSSGNRIDFGPKDPVTVGVSHRLHLSIPYASALFADGTHQTVAGQTAYSIVTATSTMTLEGYDVNLPELPEVEREQ